MELSADSNVTSSTATPSLFTSSRTIKSEALNALSLRFTEGPRNDPQKLPADLCCGPRAFHPVEASVPSLASKAEKRPGRLDLVVVSKESCTVSRFRSLSDEFNRLRRELKSVTEHLSGVVRLLNSAASNGDGSVTSLEQRVTTLEKVIEKIVDALRDTKERILKEKEHLTSADAKVKQWTANLMVSCAQHRRELERREVLHLLSSRFGVDGLLHPRRRPAPTPLTPCVPSNENTLSSKGLPPSIARLVNDAYSRILRNKSQRRGESILHDCTPNLPPVTNGVFGMDSAVAELGLARHLVGGVRSDTVDWIHARRSRVTELSRKAWVMYNATLKRLRRLTDEENSVHRHFPILRPDQPIRLLNLLGKGGFAEVWQGVHLDTLDLKAIKVIELNPAASSEEQEFILMSTCQEVTLQRNLKHPHVVEMQQCFEITPSIFVASLDLCDGGTLEQYIQMEGPLPEPLARKWMRQILLALEYIHNVGKAVHFDIKPTNILLHRGSIKISDFGLHQPVGAKGTATLDMTEEQNQIGTVWYMPPEHLYAALMQETSIFDTRFDVWSAGVVLYEMLYQRRPFGAAGNTKGCTYDHVAAILYADMVRGELLFDNAVNKVSEGCQNFLNRLLQPVTRRPTATEALSDVYLSEAHAV